MEVTLRPSMIYHGDRVREVLYKGYKLKDFRVPVAGDTYIVPRTYAVATFYSAPEAHVYPKLIIAKDRDALLDPAIWE